MAILNRRALLAVGVGGALTALTTALWAAPKFLSGSITSSDNRRTRVALQADGDFKYRYFTLSQPDRLVIDIDGMVQNNALMALANKVQPNDSFIARIRLGQKDAQTVRIVFDLKRPIQANISRNKNNLIVDLVEKTTNPNTIKNAVAAPATQKAKASSNQSDELGALIEQRQQQYATDTTVQKSATKRRPVIMLDAGHGGKDPGAIGPSGLKEKDVTLAYALETKRLLEAKGYEVHMTRDNDTFVKLADRRRKARDVKADLFISIHANASEQTNVRGSDIFVWGAQANSERARKLAQAENDVDYMDGMPSVGNKNVDMILTDMMRTQTETDSSRLGNQILRRFTRHGKVLQNQVEKGDFVVLRSLDIPSILIELAFISNPQDEKLLADKAYRRNMSVAIADSVENYLKNAILNS
ncbi:N-acetylmuramoyl-L-alanine amidase [Neisseriaceae bacterium B1]